MISTRVAVRLGNASSPCLFDSASFAHVSRDLYVMALTALQEESESNELSYFQIAGE